MKNRSGGQDRLVGIRKAPTGIPGLDAASDKFRGEVLAQINEVVIALDNDHRVTYMNPAAEKQYGFEASEALGRRLEEIYQFKWVDPDDEARAAELLETRGYWRGENIHVKTTGEEVHVESSVSVIKGRNGEDSGLLAIIRDITERKRAERNSAFLAEVTNELSRLTNAEEIMRLVGARIGEYLDLSVCAFVEVDEAFEKAVINHDWHRDDRRSSAGVYSLSEYIKDDFRQAGRAGEIFIVSNTQVDPRVNAEAYAVLKIGAFTSVPLLRDKQTRYLLVAYDQNPREWRPDEVELLNELTTRIWTRVERARVEEELRRTEKELRDFVENATVGMHWVAPDGTILWANRAELEMLGYSKEEYIGRNITEFHADGDVIHDMLLRLTEREKLDNHEATLLAKDGSVRHVIINSDVLWEGDVFVHTRCFTRDITERKLAEEALRHAHHELESRVIERTRELADANAALQREMEERQTAEKQRIDLLQQVVTTQENERRRIARDLHDQLGQRLTGLRLKIASLKTDVATDDKVLERVQGIEEIAAAVDTEVGFLVWELRPASLDEHGLVSAVKSFVEDWSRHYQTEADFMTNGLRTPRFDKDIETQLYRIVQEGLNNIVKHAQASRVSVLLKCDGDDLKLIIEDNGVGFDPATKGASREVGRGLGLIGMGERAMLVGGDVQVESEPGAGTTIFVRVPLSNGCNNGN
ncbi:MAG: PAS domain S-box protein [Pyrinomonadaceae bacterium]